MNIPPYWAKQRYEATDLEGKTRSTIATGWSFSSMQDAVDDAAARAKRVFELVSRNQKPDAYDYIDHPVKEEIVQHVDCGEQAAAVITRNRYGALVLNTENVLFIDIDLPEIKPAGLLESIGFAFSGKKREAKRQEMLKQQTGEVESWASRHSTHSFRLYQTHSGLRLLFTDKLYDPTSSETADLLNDLRADPMYIKLTGTQQCFRARLTSKPWRCGFTRPSHTYPWIDEQAEYSFRQWERDYEAKDASYKTCSLIKQFGQLADDETIRTIVAVHDHETKIDADLPLA